MSNEFKVFKTISKNVSIVKLDKNDYSYCVNSDLPSITRVGPIYKTKFEAFVNLREYVKNNWNEEI